MKDPNNDGELFWMLCFGLAAWLSLCNEHQDEDYSSMWFHMADIYNRNYATINDPVLLLSDFFTVLNP